MDYDPYLDGDTLHVDDITPDGFAHGVRLIRVDRAAVARRNLGYLKERIALTKAHEAGLLAAAA